MQRSRGLFGGAPNPGTAPPSPSVSCRSDTHCCTHADASCRRPFGSRRPQHKDYSSFQQVKQQLLSYSQPNGLGEEGAPPDIADQLRSLDVSGGPLGAPRGCLLSSSASANSLFPFSDGLTQRPSSRRERTAPGGAPPGEGGAPAAGWGPSCSSGFVSASRSREPSAGGRPLGFAGVCLASSTQAEGGRGPPSPSEEGPPFCSPGGPEEAEYSTTATAAQEAAVAQQQPREQQQVDLGEGGGAQDSKLLQLQRQDDRAYYRGLGFVGAGADERRSRGCAAPLSARIGRCIDTLTSVCRLSLTVAVAVVVGGSLSMLCYSLLMDIMLQEQQRQAEAAAAAAACRQRHRDNGCETLNPIPPYLIGPCSEWRACLMAVPEHHGETTKVAAQVVAQVLNAFFHSLHWRTIVAVSGLLWLLLYSYKALHSSLSVAPPSNYTSVSHKVSPYQQQAGAPPPVGPPLLPLLQQQQQEKQLLQQLEYEREVLRQQILRGSSPQLLLQSLGRQEAVQRELAFVLSAEGPAYQRLDQQPQLLLPPSLHAQETRPKKPGFLRALLRSWVFKFLVLLWLLYACAVGCMYAVRHNLLQLPLLAGWQQAVVASMS